MIDHEKESKKISFFLKIKYIETTSPSFCLPLQMKSHKKLTLYLTQPPSLSFDFQSFYMNLYSFSKILNSLQNPFLSKYMFLKKWSLSHLPFWGMGLVCLICVGCLEFPTYIELIEDQGRVEIDQDPTDMEQQVPLDLGTEIPEFELDSMIVDMNVDMEFDMELELDMAVIDMEMIDLSLPELEDGAELKCIDGVLAWNESRSLGLDVDVGCGGNQSWIYFAAGQSEIFLADPDESYTSVDLDSLSGQTVSFNHPKAMMRGEVTVEEYNTCLLQGQCLSLEEMNVDSSVVSCNLDELDQYPQLPMNCISWQGAYQYCQFILARLPSETEWEAVGSLRRLNYPTPYGRLDPLQPEEICRYINASDCGESNPEERSIREVCHQGSEYPFCDLLGNLSEWTLDDFNNNVNDWPESGAPYLRSAESSSTECINNQDKAIRGGSHQNRINNYIVLRNLTFYERQPANCALPSTNTGFRCIIEFPPSSLSLSTSKGQSEESRSKKKTSVPKPPQSIPSLIQSPPPIQSIRQKKQD